MADNRIWLVYILESAKLHEEEDMPLSILGAFDNYKDAMCCFKGAVNEAFKTYRYYNKWDYTENHDVYTEGVVCKRRVSDVTTMDNPWSNRYADIYIRLITVNKDIYNLSKTVLKAEEKELNLT